MSAFAIGLPVCPRTIPSTSPTSGQRMFVHICPTGQSGSGVAERITYGGASLKPVNSPRRRSLIGPGGSRVSFGYVYVCSNSSVSGVTVCLHLKVRMSVHVYVESGPSCTGSGVTDAAFGVPSPDTFFVGVEDCAIEVAVCGGWAKLFGDAKDSDAINTQHRVK